MRNLRNLAALTSAASTVREVLQLPLDKVISKPQVRVQFRNLQELADSLKEEGQQSPIIVSPENNQGQYCIQKGERRWRAAKLAGLESIDVIVNTKDQTPMDLLTGQLIENIQRDNLTPLEIAEGINKLTGSGWSKSKVAQRLGKSNSYVTLYSSIHALPQDIKNLHNNGYVTDATSLDLLGRIYHLDQKEAKFFFHRIKENTGMSRDQIRKRLSELQNPTQNDKQAQEIIKPKNDEQETSHQKETAVVSARKINPYHVLIQVLVSDGEEDHIGQLMVGYVSNHNDMAWVLIDDQPTEVNITDISILEIRDKTHE